MGAYFDKLMRVSYKEQLNNSSTHDMISFSLICKRNLPYVEETESHDEL